MANEQYGFVFALVFIVIFATVVSTIPADLQGKGEAGDTITPVNPSLISDFTDSKNFTKAVFIGFPSRYSYDDLGGYNWLCAYASETFVIAAKVLWLGLWLGALSYVEFINENGTNLGPALTFDDITNDAVDGTVRYNLIFEDNGNDAGAFVIYWNTTTYATPALAWDASALYLLHGIGITANTNLVSLLIQLLFLQLPDCPILLSVIFATPLWASIIYLLWFILVNSIPFLGGG